MEGHSRIPEGLSYAMRQRLDHDNFSEKLNKLYSEVAQDPDQQNIRIQSCLTLFRCTCKDDSWLLSHQKEAQQIVDHTLKLYREIENSESKEKILSVIQKYLPNLKEHHRDILPNDLIVEVNGQEMPVNKSLLEESKLFKLMLQGKNRFLENRKDGTIQLQRESSLNTPYIKMLNDYRLENADQLSMHELEELLELSAREETSSITNHLLEKPLLSLITNENAYYLYHLAKHYQLQNLASAASDHISKALDKTEVFDLLEALSQEENDQGPLNGQDLINCCLHFCIQQLDSSDNPFKTEVENYLPLCTRLEGGSTDALSGPSFNWLIERLPNHMQSLDFSKRPMSKVPNLSRFTQLEELHLENCTALTDLTGVKQVKGSLKILNINGCTNLKNMNVITQCEKLTQLAFIDCTGLSSTALKALGRMENLSEVELYYDAAKRNQVDEVLRNWALDNGYEVNYS